MFRKFVLPVAVVVGLAMAAFTPKPAHAAGEGTLLYNLALGGACFKLAKTPQGSLVCGATVAFADYVYRNRTSLLYLLAYSGGRVARVTTPCVIANGVRYYCL